MNNPLLPDWFDTALEATRRNYARIDVLKLVCPLCGCPVHVASSWIGLPKQEAEMTFKDYRAEVYPFCVCAQACESERLIHIVSQKRLEPDLERMPKWWAFVASWYHKHLAAPDSAKHRLNMLAGYPTWELAKFIIDPGADIDDPLGPDDQDEA